MSCKIYKEDNEKLVLYFEGRIDANNAPDVESEIFNIIKNCSKNLVFDFTKLEYISSAGLRVLLKVKKINHNLEIIEVSNEVYDIFEMTGFTSMMNITKKLRIVSTEGLKRIGEGAVGKVFRLDEERIIKVFKRAGCIDDVNTERNMAKKAFMLGIPTAISYEIVKTPEGYYGSIFELLRSDCFNTFYINHPEEKDKFTKLYVELFKQVISTKAMDGILPDKKERAYKVIETLRAHKVLEENILDKIELMIKTLPNTNTLVHGDLHIKNIMMQNGEPILIDMETIGVGHPIFEFTPLWLCYYCYASTDPDKGLFFGIPIATQRYIYDSLIKGCYGDKTKSEIREIQEKIILWSCFDMCYRVIKDEGENDYRTNYCKNIIYKLINKYDSLNF